jgi:hypothetical protein
LTMKHPDKADSEREYEKSGFYPENAKPFRIWALLAWLGGTVVFLAVVSALLNLILL